MLWYSQKSSETFDTIKVLCKWQYLVTFLLPLYNLLRGKYVGGNEAGERQGDDHKISSHYFMAFLVSETFVNLYFDFPNILTKF